MIMASATTDLQPVTNVPDSSSFTQILQSDTVRKLFEQPNIVIHAIPRTNSPTAYKMIKPKPIEEKDEINKEIHQPNKEASIQITNTSSNERNEEENLLPSKTNGKSEILLVPIVRERKPCGHFEPCESLVCDVNVQQYEDEEGITPLISINMDEDDETDAPVNKHCENEKCDALSIDHDECRRASIQVYHCDKHSICDICETTLTCPETRTDHKKCRRKTIYEHNNASPSEIFKYRMRERELQILETARLKKSERFLDPVTGFGSAMEALMKKDELIIIPKMAPLQQKAYSQNNIYQNHVNNIIKNSGNKKGGISNADKELTSEMISNIIKSCQETINMKKHLAKSNTLPTKQIMLSEHLNGATVNIMDEPPQKKEPAIDYVGLSLNGVKITPVSEAQVPKLVIKTGLPFRKTYLNSISKPNSITGPFNNKKKRSQKSNLKKLSKLGQSFTTPYKMVPIAELKSEPSLLHQAKGVPKFCFVPDTTAQLQPKEVKMHKNKKFSLKKKQAQVPKLSLKTKMLNAVKLRPLQPALSGNVQSTDANVDAATVDLNKKQKGRKRIRKKLLKKGKFKCTHCPKRFTSIEYCKLHISKHENNPGFFCGLCEKGFLNKYIMKKHIDSDHKAGEVRCEICNSILLSLQDLFKHMKCPETKVIRPCSECTESFDTCSNLDFHMKKEHGFLICSLCKRQIAKSKMTRHLMLEHSLSKNRSENNFDKLTYPAGENESVSEIDLVIPETPVKKVIPLKTESPSENKVEVDCLARNRSVRRRNSKELFVCSVCDRRFENEKQYQIHLANNPMKFTLCPVCSKKFHRKAEYTEHSKTCNRNLMVTVKQTTRRRKLDPPKTEVNVKINIASQNSIDQKLSENIELNACKKLKLNNERIVQINDKEENVQKEVEEEIVQKEEKEEEEEDEEIVSKNVVETQIVNGSKQNSCHSSKNLLIGNEINIDNQEYYNTNGEDEPHLLLNIKNTIECPEDSERMKKSVASVVSSIYQDHNYQALR